MKRASVDPVVINSVLHNKMPAQKSYTLDAFHIPFNRDSICNSGMVLSDKLPPDQLKVRLLNTAAYLVTFICIMISTTNCNGVLLFCSSAVKPVPETSEIFQFPNSDVLQVPYLNDVPNKIFPEDYFCLIYPTVQAILIENWTNDLDWNSSELLQDWTSQLDWLGPPSKLSKDVRPGSRCRSSLDDEDHHNFYYLLINVPTNNIMFFTKFNIYRYFNDMNYCCRPINNNKDFTDRKFKDN